MKIYTKTGDKGQTSLFGGGRVAKSHLRIEAYGALDELNAYIGLLSDQEVNAQHNTRAQRLQAIQSHLFVIGSHLATPLRKSQLALPELPTDATQILEQDIDEMNEKVPPLRHFILPGGHRALSIGHVARCVCRRAERRMVELQASGENMAENILPYINRLSDYLFMLIRMMAQELSINERPWIPKKSTTPKK